ncbi:alpha-mannosidase [Bacteroidia bacterium]|nr:alpha-mannosidase [Bacteroidia bacterium]
MRIIVLCALLAGAIVASPLQAAAPTEKWTREASKYRFDLVGHGHIDPVWLWPWTEGVAVVHSTFRSALDRMNEYPDFKFSASSAQFYRWIEQNDPAMLDEIRRRVDQGRWELAGGWWIEPDVNIPCGEALVRQGLYGQLTFERLFGRRVKIGFSPDSFGHSASLPQILKGQGMTGYVFMRPLPYERTFPSELFLWEGIDGTQIECYHIQDTYNVGKGTNDLRPYLNKVIENYGGRQLKDFMMFYGVGDHGGGPTISNLNSIEALRKEKGGPVLRYSTMESYFDRMSRDKTPLPVVGDELQILTAGCLTAESAIKKANRTAETAMITAEKIASVGSVAWGVAYPREGFGRAWERLMFMQFHDIIAGTTLVSHSGVSREAFDGVLDMAHQSTGLALQRLEWQVAAEDPASKYWVVFNPHAWEVRECVEIDVARSYVDAARMEDEQGRELPCQWIESHSQTTGYKRMLVEVSVPPMGYRQIRLREVEPSALSHRTAVVDRCAIENEYYTLTVRPDGSVALYDKLARRQVFDKGGCRAVILRDTSDTWSHDVRAFDCDESVFDHASCEVLERGPLRSTIRATTRYNASTLTIEWSLCAASRNVEANVTLDWHERLKMLKFSFPVALPTVAQTATYEIPYGSFTRPNNGEEVPGLRWASIGGEQGLTLANDAKYGYSARGNDLRLTVARSAVFAHHDPIVLKKDHPSYHWMDQGMQSFRMTLAPNGPGRDPVRLAEQLCAPMLSIAQGIHRGTLPKAASFASTNNPQVQITALKLAEKGDDIIVRCVETSGRPAQVTIALDFLKTSWRGELTPFEIRTLRIDRTTGAVKTVNLLEE